jgi:hypothetical protein
MTELRTPTNKQHCRQETHAVPLVCALFIGWLAYPQVLHADEGTLPDAAAILDGYVEATGGKAAYEKIHNRVNKGSVVHVGMGFEDSRVEYEEEPNKHYVHIESDALGDIDLGTDGDVVWYLMKDMGPLIEEGAARDAQLREAAFNGVVRWREFYREAECVGEETVDGAACYKVVMTPYAGEPETRYYDQQTHLLVKVQNIRLSSHMPAMPTEITFSDYRWVDGLLIPHQKKRVFEQCGSKREMLYVTNSIEHNVKLPAERFDLPEEVRQAAPWSRLTSLGRQLVNSVAPQGGTGQTQTGCGGGGETSAAQRAEKPQGGQGCGGGETTAAPAKETDRPQRAPCCGGGGTAPKKESSPSRGGSGCGGG